ncbi:hypothetical protein HMPREF9445_03045 [Bacteroides clarus YIT 12056]|uniref:Uncharacterized protein n=1 Tax=Bacteroides clarus YIT 12056 TaxID=762984 RepID=A0ABP2KS45_9BACE|nr:hypothetical protein HMPREF9445_03045 [Bacteroides clarus YIT 12056]
MVVFLVLKTIANAINIFIETNVVTLYKITKQSAYLVLKI